MQWARVVIDRRGRVVESCNNARTHFEQMGIVESPPGDQPFVTPAINRTLWRKVASHRDQRYHLVVPIDWSVPMALLWRPQQPQRLNLCLVPDPSGACEHSTQWLAVLDAARIDTNLQPPHRAA